MFESPCPQAKVTTATSTPLATHPEALPASPHGPHPSGSWLLKGRLYIFLLSKPRGGVLILRGAFRWSFLALSLKQKASPWPSPGPPVPQKLPEAGVGRASPPGTAPTMPPRPAPSTFSVPSIQGDYRRLASWLHLLNLFFLFCFSHTCILAPFSRGFPQHFHFYLPFSSCR